MKLYQLAVEYFSASESGVEMSKQIMDRMQGIMSRENVQKLLAPATTQEESKEFNEPSAFVLEWYIHINYIIRSIQGFWGFGDTFLKGSST